MIHINRNRALEQLSNLLDNSLDKNLNYMPDNFNVQQNDALELLKKRIYLEEVIEESVDFNRKLNWKESSKNLKLVNSAEELVEVFKIRSNVYAKIGYNEECPDNIEGLNFDNYDKNSAILYYKNDRRISGTLRLILDSENKLPTDKKFSFNNLRKEYKTIGELSRFVVENESKGLSLEFKNLFAGVHTLFTNNDIDLVVTAIKKEHYKLYSKFGGTNIEKELEGYGLVNLPFLVMSWNPSEASDFFKRAFLK